MKNITLKQMRYFEALVRHQHFGRAADACAISQPALSMQIRDLETALGAALFERSARGVRPTDFGVTVSSRIRAVLQAVDELAVYSEKARGGAVNRLRLGVIPTIAPYLLPGLIPALKQRYAGIDLNIRESLTESLIAELLDSRLDAAIVALPISEPAFEEVPLIEEPFVLVRPASTPAPLTPKIEDLRNERLLLLEEGHCFRDQALSFCHIRSTAPKDTLDGSSLSTLVQMVGAGLGVTLIPKMAVAVETRAAQVSLATFDPPMPSRTIGMVWRRKTPLAETLAEIAGLVKDTTRKLVEG